LANPVASSSSKHSCSTL